MDSTSSSLANGFFTSSWRTAEEAILAYEQDVAHGNAQSLSTYLPDGDPTLRRYVSSELAKVAAQLHGGPDFPTVLRELKPGLRFGNFDIIQLLGEGAFARIFLAKQCSMDRYVALKISATRSAEARTLAGFDHENIVRVFSDTLLEDRPLRVLCMQYVPGTTLARTMAWLAQRGLPVDGGPTYIDAVAELSRGAGLLGHAEAAMREQMRNADLVESTAWVGEQLAAALEVVHAQGVVHCDIKPANVLVTPGGRPMLTDFNLSIDSQRISPVGPVIGGTPAYMAPEHLAAFHVADTVTERRVDGRADVFSLGIVLYEMSTGRLPGEPATGEYETDSCTHDSPGEAAWHLVPSPRDINPGLSFALDQVIQRAIQPDRERRYSTSGALRGALEGVRRLRVVEKTLPMAGGLAAVLERCPFACLNVLCMLPNLAAAVVLVLYQLAHVIPRLTTQQREWWLVLTIVDFLIALPLAMTCCLKLRAPLHAVWRRLTQNTEVPLDEAVAARRNAVQLSMRGVAVAGVSWMGGELFVLGGLAALSDVSLDVALHHFASFALASVIAITYSYFVEEFVAIRILYPKLWSDPSNLPSVAHGELRTISTRLRTFQLLAGAIPLTGAAMIVLVGPAAPFADARVMQLLTVCLIFIGIFGFAISMLVAHWIGGTLRAFLGQ